MAENNSSNHQTTQYSAITGGVSNTLNNVAPSATSGVALISQGVASQPIFGTVVAAGGGTGRTTLTVNSVLCGNATSTIGMTNAATDGQLLIGKTAAIPAFATVTSSDSSITFTPGANTLSMQVAGYSGFVVGPASATDNALCRFDNTTGKLIQNGVITEDDTGNLSISAAVSGGNLSCIVSNTSNTASSQAFYQAQVAGGTAADAYYVANISGGQGYSWGVDNSDSDAFVLSATVTPGTTNVMRVATTGEINYSLQPAFLATMTGAQNNVTGNATLYTLQWTTEIYDQNGDFDAVSTFTAPVTGRYQFNAFFCMSGFAGGTVNGSMAFKTSNRAYELSGLAVNSSQPPNNYQYHNGSTYADMDAADTVTVTTLWSGGTLTTDVVTTTAYNYFSGKLVC